MILRRSVLVLATVALSCGFALGEQAAVAELVPGRLRCEYLIDPIGIDVREPRLNWMVASPKRGARQTAYQLLVASSPEGLAAGQGDLWDSGRVESDQTLHVVYRGRTLRSGQQCYWKDDQGRRVGDHRLAPEWTAYRKRLQYQTYDVTDLLRQGDNAIGATLGEGWHAGPLMSRPALPSPVFRLLVRLDVEMAGGSRQSIVSDGSWRGTPVGEPRHPM